MTPIEQLDPDLTLDLARFFCSLELIDAALVRVAAIGEVLCLWCMLPDFRRQPVESLITPYMRLVTMQQSGSAVLSAALAGVATTARISLLRLSTPECAFVAKYRWFPFWSDPTPWLHSWSKRAHC
jgi:hypothetical protein